jgi:hypothetical protein
VLRLSARVAVAAALALFALVGTTAGREPASKSTPWASDGAVAGAAFSTSLERSTFAPGSQHGGANEHLAAARENIDVVGKLRMQTPAAFKFHPDTDLPDPSQPDVVPGQIADLAVHKNAAYLASWSEPSCKRGGFFSVDISNPAAPRQLAFVPTSPETYHGEGMHARTISTPAFTGDVLAVNNEPCPSSLIGRGGFDLYDVSNPANPQVLIQDAGDRSPDHGPGEAFAPTTQNPADVPNSSHSIFIWQDGPRAFAVIQDNTEGSDVDIFDITNPRAPEFIADVDLDELAIDQGNDIVENSANGNAVFHHDMIVKEIGGVQTMLASYWDAGYVKVNVDDPRNPRIIGDSRFDNEDPLVTDPRTGRGFSLPEGNGHQAEFSHDNRFVLAADEDFSTYRLPEFRFTTGSYQGLYPAGEFGFTRPMASLEDNRLNGPTLYGGYGCDADDDIPVAPGGLTLGPDEESIVVLQRGPQSATADPSAPYAACTFQEKAENAAAKGWDAVIIGNHHSGAGNGSQPEAALCGSGTGADIIGLCLGHEPMHKLFDEPPGKRPVGDYDYTTDPTHEPQVGDVGSKIETTSLFDGWGYTHLYRNDAGGDLTAVDHFAIEEAIDERYAFGFGDLSVHEFATDPTEYLAYTSYYAGGMRVFRFGDAGLEQTGKFIDQGGNNFWGVEQFTTPQGERLFAGSDRDFGLYLFRYTGPGAAQRPACTDVTVMVPFRETASVPLTCSDANNNPLRQSRLSTPGGGTVTDRPPAGGWSYQHTGNRLGPAGSFTFRANDGAADSNTATASLVAVAKRGRCVNPFIGTNRRDVIVGSRFGDRIRGRRANDSLRGRRGRDCLVGNAGRDRLSGQANADRLSGSRGRDRLAGQAGRDRLFGNQGPDRLSGGGSGDRMRGGGGKNRYFGGAGPDRVFARNAKVDRVRCGKGRDRVRADRRDRVADDCERVRRR